MTPARLARTALTAIGCGVALPAPVDSLGGLFDDVMSAVGGKKVLAKKMGVRESDLKTLQNPTWKDVAHSVSVTAKVAGAAGALLIPGVNIAAAGSLGGAAVLGDKLLSTANSASKEAAKAKQVLDNTKALAAAGNADAQRGIAVLRKVEQTRAAVKAPAGVPLPTTAKGSAAMQNFLADMMQKAGHGAVQAANSTIKPGDARAAHAQAQAYAQAAAAREKAATAKLDEAKERLERLRMLLGSSTAQRVASVRDSVQRQIDALLKEYPALAQQQVIKLSTADLAKAVKRVDALPKPAMDLPAVRPPAATQLRGWFVYSGGERKGEIRQFGSWKAGGGTHGIVISPDGKINKGQFAAG